MQATFVRREGVDSPKVLTYFVAWRCTVTTVVCFNKVKPVDEPRTPPHVSSHEAKVAGPKAQSCVVQGAEA